MASTFINPTLYAAAHILCTSITVVLLIVFAGCRTYLTNLYINEIPVDWVLTRSAIPGIVLGVHWIFLSTVGILLIVLIYLPGTYGVRDRLKMSVTEFQQRLNLVSSQRQDVRLVFAIIGFISAAPLLGTVAPLLGTVAPLLGTVVKVGSGLVAPGLLLGFLASTIGAAPIMYYIALVHTVERALLERDDKQRAKFSHCPIISLALPPVPITCFICHDDITSQHGVAAYHSSDQAVSQTNLSGCKVYHQSCLIQWWRNDRTKTGQCPERTTVPQWSRIAFTEESR
jgi:hypothetical protein